MKHIENIYKYIDIKQTQMQNKTNIHKTQNNYNDTQIKLYENTSMIITWIVIIKHQYKNTNTHNHKTNKNKKQKTNTKQHQKHTQYKPEQNNIYIFTCNIIIKHDQTNTQTHNGNKPKK